MLVLSRKRGESILIGDDIQVTFLSFRGDDGIRLGIEAPADVPVDRPEVRRAKLADKEPRRDGE